MGSRTFFCLLVAAFCVGLSTCDQTPSISFITPEIVTDIGGNVELTCTIENGKEYPILWMRIGGKREPFPISTGPSLLVHDKRFSLENNPETGSYILSIRDVQKTDEAKYQCQVVVSLNNMLTKEVDLKVKMPPVIAEDDTPVKRVIAGKSIELSCEASGFPSPKISWRKKDGTLLPTGKEVHNSPKLVISEAKRQDRGNYVCRADNGVGKRQERVTTLEVEFKPKIDVPKPKVPQAAYYEAHLICDIEAFPPPAINWKRNSDIITNNSSFQISHFASADERTTSTLKVLSVTKEQFGKYTCEAANRHGTASQHMELYESSTPICPPLCGNTDLNSSSSAKTPITFISLVTILAFVYFC